MKKIWTLIILCFSICTYSQSVEIEDNCIYDLKVIDLKPEPREGLEKLNSYLTENFQKTGLGKTSEEKIFALFVVEKDGSLSDIKIVGKVDPNEAQELIGKLRSLPKWIPGQHKGKFVRAMYPLVILFDK